MKPASLEPMDFDPRKYRRDRMNRTSDDGENSTRTAEVYTLTPEIRRNAYLALKSLDLTTGEPLSDPKNRIKLGWKDAAFPEEARLLLLRKFAARGGAFCFLLHGPEFYSRIAKLRWKRERQRERRRRVS